MNFWTFLDKNSVGLGLLFLIVLAYSFGTCGDGHGCRVQCGERVRIETGPHADAGAP